jgi:16S rRNA processing protein RimM
MSSTPTADGDRSGHDARRAPDHAGAGGPGVLLVGVVVRPHGLRGELLVDVHTDAPHERFAPGAVLLRTSADGVAAGVLTVGSARPHAGRLLVRFTEAPDRAAAEALRGSRLLVDATALPPTGDPDEFHVHQLEGLAAQLVDGTAVGTVREVVHGPGGELLVLARPGRPDALVPFVRAIVPTVDVDGGRVVLDPPEGLLDLP